MFIIFTGETSVNSENADFAKKLQGSVVAGSVGGQCGGEECGGGECGAGNAGAGVMREFSDSKGVKMRYPVLRCQ